MTTRRRETKAARTLGGGAGIAERRMPDGLRRAELPRFARRTAALADARAHEKREVLWCPNVGVAAGRREPMVAEERDPARLHDFDSFVRQCEARPDYFLRVKGGSLDRTGFRTGDTVAVRCQPEANDGDLVVARIGQGVTLKRLRRVNKNCVELQPESTNANHRSIRIDAETEDVEIVGVIVGAVVGVLRCQSNWGM